VADFPSRPPAISQRAYSATLAPADVLASRAKIIQGLPATVLARLGPGDGFGEHGPLGQAPETLTSSRHERAFSVWRR
jgi:hypothetical protein